MKRILLSITLLLSFHFAFSQFPQMGKGSGGMMNQFMNMGHYYGKIVDSATGAPIEFASVSIWGTKWDTASRTNVYGLLAGMITTGNGDFSLEGLPVFSEFKLVISFVGYTTIERQLSFNLNMNDMQKQASGGKQDFTAMINLVDKDLGNIKMVSSSKQLKEVVVDGTAPMFEMKLDKKVFNVEKNSVAQGGTAQDVLKQVPSVNVDMDGNVTLRNAAPQIFVDGKPTTLTLDQIPADAIESVELITNPSAKYDASGGQGGILNIVLKKARRIGYNGDVRGGIDQRGKYNLGGDLSSRQGKFNFFLSAMYNQRKSIMTAETDRTNLMGIQPSIINQNDDNSFDGYFVFARAGLDWFIDNRNTITLSGIYPKGSFDGTDNLSAYNEIDTFGYKVPFYYTRNSATSRSFNNLGGSMQYKHIFPQEGRELTFDFNYNKSKFTSVGNFNTQYYDNLDNPYNYPILQLQNGLGSNKFFTGQTDYVNPIGTKMKLEMGLRGAVKDFLSSSDNKIKTDSANSDYVSVTNANYNYEFIDQVYAAYTTFSHQLKKFSYQVGLRVESSFYSGKLLDSTTTFKNQYPISLFPSGSATYSITDNTDFQVSYSRRINRPSFFNLIPYIDYTDSLNLSKGNPNLKPEFTNSLELSYLHNFDRSNNLLASLWYKNTNDLITRFQVSEFDSVLHRNVIINTYENANSSDAYGFEITVKNTITKWVDLTTNANFYNSQIIGSAEQNGITNKQFSWFGKLIMNIKLPANFSIQLTGNYQSQTSLPINNQGGGMMNYGGGASSTLQGYNKATYGLDGALKFEFMKNKAASLTLNCSDILKTRKSETYSESIYFIQTTSRIRDQQFFRLNFFYRFGKFDVSLFKRKNMKVNTEGLEGAPGM